MEKKSWQAINTQTVFKAVCQVIEKVGDNKKILASEIPDQRLAAIFAELPVDMRIMQELVDYVSVQAKASYNLRNPDTIPIYKLVHYIQKRIDTFTEVYGQLPSIEKKMKEYKPETI